MNDEELRSFNENLAELNKVLPGLVQGITLSAQVFSQQASNANTSASAQANSNKELNRYIQNQQKLNPIQEARLKAEEQLARESQNFSNALGSSTTAVKSFGTALLSTEKNFSKYGSAIESAGDAVFNLSKNFGLLGTVVGGLVKGITKVASAGLEQADATLKATDALSKFGSAGAFTSKEVLAMGHSAGLTSKNLEVLVKAAEKAGTGLTGLGSTAGEGMAAFAKVTAVTTEQREAFQRLGISQEELMGHQADYIKLQELSGKSLATQAKDSEKLKKASLEYTENLLRLSQLTGKSVDKLAQEQAIAQEEFEELVQTRAEDDKIRKLRMEGKKAEADALQNEQDARKAFINDMTSRLGKEAGTLMGKMARTGTFDTSTAGFANLGMNPAEIQRQLKEAKGAEGGKDLANQQLEVYKQQSGQRIAELNTAMQYAGESLGKQFGITKETLQLTGKRVGIDEAAADKAAKEAIGKPAEGTTGAKVAEDTAQKMRNLATTTEIAAQVFKDKLLASVNPLISGFNATTIATTALTAAAVAAAAALAAIGVKNKIGSVLENIPEKPRKPGKGKKGGTKPPTPPKTPPAAKPVTSKVTPISAAKGPSTASKVLSGAGKLAGPAAGVVAVGTGAYSAYSGYKDVEEQVKKGEITKEEGTVKKGEAVGGGVGSGLGGLGGAAAGAALGTMIFPVVGTAIGGILGGLLGSWGGEKAGTAVGNVVGGAVADKPTTTQTPDTKDLNKSTVTDTTKAEPVPLKKTQQLSEEQQKSLKIDKETLDSTKAVDILLKELIKVNKIGFSDMIASIDDVGVLVSGKADDKQLERILQKYKMVSGTTGAATSGGATAAGTVEGGGPVGAKPATAAPPKLDSGGRMTAASDPRALGVEPQGSEKELLDFIGKHESNGNYNILVGGGKADLTNMSLQEVLDFQKTMRASGKESTAVGKYQIIKSTLEGLIKESGMSLDTKFDQATQDKLGLLLLKRRGLDKYSSGQMDANTFADNLAKEWASLPTQSGKSYYAGVGSNKAGSSRNDFMASLPKAQAEMGGLFEGSAAGYGVTLHNREAVVPLPDPNSTITVNTPDEPYKEPLSSVMATNTNSNPSMDSLVGLTSDMIDMLSEKLDNMIDKLSVANELQDQLLKYSKV